MHDDVQGFYLWRSAMDYVWVDAVLENLFIVVRTLFRQIGVLRSLELVSGSLRF
jgi:hypothetical protein